MIISIIVATTRSGVIGKGGDIPWHLPADLAHFKATTMGHPIIMGRVTHESIGKALPGRRNIIITSDNSYVSEGCEVVGSLEEALELVKNEAEVFIIGGQSIYKQALPLAECIYLTEVDAEIEGDKFFVYDPNEWHIVSSESHKADKKNPYNYRFITLEKSSN